MLTCKLGKTKINALDYDKAQLKKWSKKELLKCPVCDGKMIYKNGEYKVAHFAHGVDCKCKLKYHESETIEHTNGKIAIYKWLKTQPVKNLELECWIPETRQRPDIYFEYMDERYAIEYQCSPISGEYLERTELYRLAGINDIWILGIEKYGNERYIELPYCEMNKEMAKIGTKVIERELFNKYGTLYHMCNNYIYQTSSFSDIGFKTQFDMTINFSDSISKTNIRNLVDFEKWEISCPDVYKHEHRLLSICEKLNSVTLYNCNMQHRTYKLKNSEKNGISINSQDGSFTTFNHCDSETDVENFAKQQLRTIKFDIEVNKKTLRVIRTATSILKEKGIDVELKWRQGEPELKANGITYEFAMKNREVSRCSFYRYRTYLGRSRKGNAKYGWGEGTNHVSTISFCSSDDIVEFIKGDINGD